MPGSADLAVIVRWPAADAVICTPLLAPSDEGAGFCGAKDWGREYSSSCFSPSVFAYGESTSLIRGRLLQLTGYKQLADGGKAVAGGFPFGQQFVQNLCIGG